MVRNYPVFQAQITHFCEIGGKTQNRGKHHSGGPVASKTIFLKCMNDSSPLSVQLYCERCTGSNFLESFLTANLPQVQISEKFGFKHWLSQEFLDEKAFPQEMPFILLIRSPYDWVRSIYRNPWHAAPRLKKLNFSRFIRAEWECVWDSDALIERSDPRWMQELEFERNPMKGFQRFRNILEVRRIKYQMWHERLADHPLYFRLAQEELEEEPETFLKSFAEKTGVALSESVMVPEGYKGQLSWKRKLLMIATQGLVGGYSKAPRYPLKPADIAFIHNHLDKEQEATWGYNLDALAELEHRFTFKMREAS